MNLLGYLVPAIRELRAPLVGGYLWLLAGWLNLGDRIPDSGSASGSSSPWRQLARFDGMLGSAGLAVAASVAAVLVGSLAGELIGRGVAWRSETPDALEDLGELVPETKYAADRALRVYSEAELRLHVAVPLAAIGISLVGGDIWIGLVVLAFALAVGVHGFFLVRRWRTRAESVRNLVGRSVDEMPDDERAEREADIRLTPTPQDLESGTGRLHVQNAGQSTARQVTLVDPNAEDGSTPSFISTGYLPIDELRPGDSVAIPYGLSLADGVTPKVLVRWIDSTGERVDERTLYFS